MIQRPAPGALDLELGILAHPGKQSFALTTPAVFQHRHTPFGPASTAALSGTAETAKPRQCGAFAWAKKNPAGPGFSNDA
jgi:hypothetical protein